MTRRISITAAWFVLVLLVSTKEANGQAPPAPQPTPIPIDVMYTGKLFGYFRNPSLQKMGDKGCPSNADDASYAAKLFLPQRQGQNSSILVGTGDNFAPELEARVFADPPKSKDKYPVGNKELYFGKADGWVFYKTDDEELEKELAAGHGVIPSDNVACFLRAAKFAAIVPGKHDFYFGPERVREFARFLASKAAGDYEQPVQMLGANLVLKTVPIDGSTSKAVEQPGIGGWPKEYSVLNLKEGKTVYPWLPAIKIKLNKPGDLDNKTIMLCQSSGGPNELPDNCPELKDKKVVEQADGTIVLTVKLAHLEATALKNAKDNHFSTLLPATNYALCIEPSSAGQKLKRDCLHFSSHTPFFYFPHVVPEENVVSKENKDAYIDPDPFVVINDRVAIFGIVDPDLGEQVGILNFGWKNKQGGLTTRVSVEDPAEALEQQLEYFKELKPTFTGLKILLAQMTPQRARALASRFPEFQIGFRRRQGTEYE